MRFDFLLKCSLLTRTFWVKREALCLEKGNAWNAWTRNNKASILIQHEVFGVDLKKVMDSAYLAFLGSSFQSFGALTVRHFQPCFGNRWKVSVWGSQATYWPVWDQAIRCRGKPLKASPGVNCTCHSLYRIFCDTLVLETSAFVAGYQALWVLDSKMSPDLSSAYLLIHVAVN